MRWLPVLLLSGCLATVSTVALQSPHSLAMQATPPALSEAADTFCPEAERFPLDDESMVQPTEPTAGVVQVVDLENPSPNEATESDNGTLLLSTVTLPGHSCILGSAFYPSVVIKVTSGTIHILIEHWPGLAAAPEAFITTGGDGPPEAFALDGSTAVVAGDWVTIKNEAFVGFANREGDPAEFDVAGIKPDPDTGGGDCSGSCRGRP